MSALSVNSPAAPRRRLPPVIHWSPHLNVIAQAGLAATLAGAITLLVSFILPIAAPNGATTAGTFIHESFHILADAAFNHRWDQVVLHRDEGRHATVVNSSQAATIVIAMAGIIGTAWLAALLLMVGLIRVGVSAVLGFGGFIMLLMTAVLVVAQGDQLIVLYGVGLAAVVAGIAPVGGLTKAVCALSAGMWLTWAVFRSLPYLNITFIDDDPTRPSDMMVVAQALGRTELGDVPELFMMLIIIGYMVAALLSWAWIARHS